MERKQSGKKKVRPGVMGRIWNFFRSKKKAVMDAALFMAVAAVLHSYGENIGGKLNQFLPTKASVQAEYNSMVANYLSHPS